MFDFSDDQLKTIKKFVSHPAGMGYVLNYSNNSFSNWFRDNWNIDIDGPAYTNGELSKGDRLLSFCEKSDARLVSAVLRRLHREAMELNIENSDQVTSRSIKKFEEILRILEEVTIEATPNASPERLSKETILRNSKNGGPSLVLVASSTIEQLSEFREVVRSDNSLGATDPEIRDRLLTLLDALCLHLEKLLEIIPWDNQDISEDHGDQIVKWTERYVNAALPKLQEYVSPEALGRTSVPAGLILLCGGVGSILTGFSPIGFGAGSVVGKLLVGEMKSSAVADQLQERFPDDN